MPSLVRAIGMDEGSKHRLEHSVSDKAGCQQAACKRAGVKIAKGELRIARKTIPHPDVFGRHNVSKIMYGFAWGCATTHQIKGLKAMTSDDPKQVPGYEKISAESKDQVRLAFEEGYPMDKEWKDVREDLAKRTSPNGGEIRNATGCKVEVTGRGTAGCRNPTCKVQGIKIAKGKLRLGIAVPFDGEHETWQYKHWECISQYDFHAVKEFLEEGSLDGMDNLPEEYKNTILESFQNSTVIEPPELETAPVAKPKRTPRKKKTEIGEEEGRGDGIFDAEEGDKAAKPARKGRKKRAAEELDGANESEEPVPKRRGRIPKRTSKAQEELSTVAATKASERASKREEAADLAVANTQALTESMRTKAA